MTCLEDFENVDEFDWFDLAKGEIDRQIALTVADTNLHVNVNAMKSKGDAIKGHSHQFGHLSLCAKGSIGIEAEVNGQIVKTIVRAGRGVFIKEYIRHTIVALEDDSMFICVFSQRNPDGSVAEKFTGWPENYR